MFFTFFFPKGPVFDLPFRRGHLHICVTVPMLCSISLFNIVFMTSMLDKLYEVFLTLETNKIFHTSF